MMRMTSFLKKTTEYYLVFLIPVLIIFLSVVYARATPPDPEKPDVLAQRYQAFDESYLEMTHDDVEELQTIRQLLSSEWGPERADGIRKILADHMDPFFLIALFMSSGSAMLFLAGTGIVKHGLASLFMYIFIRKKLRLDLLTSMFFSFCYALSTPLLISSFQTPVINFAVLLPVVLCLMDTLLRREKISDTVKLSFAIGLLFMTGGHTFFITAFWLFLIGIILSVYVKKSDDSIAGGMFVLFPPFILGTSVASASFFTVADGLFSSETPKIKELVEHFEVRYTVFDELFSMTDGRILTTDIRDAVVGMSLSVLVLMMFAVFFFIRRIPFAARVMTGLTVLLMHIFLSSSLFRSVPFFYGNVTQTVLLVKILMCCLILISAAICYKNTGDSKRIIFGGVFAVLILLIIGNNSKNELSYGFTRLYFNGAAAVFWGYVLITLQKKEGGNGKIFKAGAFGAAFLGLAFNTCFSICPGSFSSDITDYSYRTKQEEEAEDLWFFSDEREYLLLTSDVSMASELMSPFELANAASRAAMCENFFEKQDVNEVYVKGLLGNTLAGYGAQTAGTRCELIVRADLVEGERYFAYSSFTGEQYLTEMYAGNDRGTTYRESFYKELECLSDHVNLRIAIISAESGTYNLDVYRLDEEKLAEVRGRVRKIGSNARIHVENDDLTSIHGKKTILTSLPYSTDITAKVAGEKLETIDYGGNLAIIVEPELYGVPFTVELSDHYGDIFIGGALTVIVSILLVVIYMYNKKNQFKLPQEMPAGNEEELAGTGDN